MKALFDLLDDLAERVDYPQAWLVIGVRDGLKGVVPSHPDKQGDPEAESAWQEGNLLGKMHQKKLRSEGR